MGQTILLVLQVLAAIGLIGLVLLQQGKGADTGASLGGGVSQTVFGSTGSGNFLTRTTAILATIFFLSSLGLSYFAKHTTQPTSLFQKVAPAKIEKAPVGDLPAVPAANNNKTVAPATNDLPVVQAKAATTEKNKK